jgi:hypothetical protein
MRRLLLTAGLAVLAAGLTVSAVQQSASITLKSGSTLTGELVDLGGVGFTFKVNGQDREIPRDDVAYIDFGGGDLDVPAQARELQAGSNVAILKSGEVVQGQFYDVQGANPIRIVFRTSSGERTFNGPDVRRIYLVPAGGSSTSASAGGGGNVRTVTVSARAWTNTGITVRQGQTLRFEASGEVTFAPNRTAGPAGSGDNLFDTKSPVPTALQGSLIGRIGGARTAGTGARAFPVGSQTTVTMPANGILFLGVNDSGLDDNRGQFTVKISE